jgi:hypothetical protein
MLVLKNVGSNESIGVIKRVFDLGYDILQKELNKLDVDCDKAFTLCVLYYNEFYHSAYNNMNISEYEAIVEFFKNNKTQISEWDKRIQLMFQICQYYEFELGFDFQTMTIYAENKGYKYHYNTMSEFALGWIVRLLNTTQEIGYPKFKIWTDDDLNRLREMGRLIHQDVVKDSFNFEIFVTDKEIELELYINRYKIEDDDELCQAIDDCEMDTNDYVIATFKPTDNISFNIFTTHNLYNVYIDKNVIYEDGSCDTVEMHNITMDACEWNNKNDIIKYFLGMNY